MMVVDTTPSCSTFLACAMFCLGYGKMRLVSFGAFESKGLTSVSLIICLPNQLIGSLAVVGPVKRPP